MKKRYVVCVILALAFLVVLTYKLTHRTNEALPHVQSGFAEKAVTATDTYTNLNDGPIIVTGSVGISLPNVTK